MEKKPIIPFLKFMSALFVIIAVWSTIAGILALVVLLLPGLTDVMAETGNAVEVTPLTYISLIVSLVCAIINIVIGTMAFTHKKLDLVYKIGIFTMIAGEVFAAIDVSGIADWITLALGLVVPILFLLAVFKQKKLDEENK